ncbi:hypothetical protein HanIR_Chr06g0286941 [Helianthus annuus]|nr:hypothetical protein HanIR_Chr06g0286941 [Helianthus annuus]
MEGCGILEHLNQMRPKFEVVGIDIRCIDRGSEITYRGLGSFMSLLEPELMHYAGAETGFQVLRLKQKENWSEVSPRPRGH